VRRGDVRRGDVRRGIFWGGHEKKPTTSNSNQPQSNQPQSKTNMPKKSPRRKSRRARRSRSAKAMCRRSQSYRKRRYRASPGSVITFERSPPHPLGEFFIVKGMNCVVTRIAHGIVKMVLKEDGAGYPADMSELSPTNTISQTMIDVLHSRNPLFTDVSFGIATVYNYTLHR
jgi:hypothetical protein